MSRLGRVGVRRHGLHVVRPLIAGLAALAALPLFGGLAGAHASTPRVVVQAPARAAVGQPITLHLAVRDARDVAGYETTLVLDSASAHLAGTRQLHGPIAASGRGVVPLGPLTVGDRTSFGLYSCPVSDCATGTGRRHAAGVSGRVALGSVTVVPERAGILELRLARTLVVDSHGRKIAARPSVVVRIQVGASHRLLRAPAAAARTGHASHARRADLDGDGAVSNGDAQAVAYAWTMQRYGHGACSASPADVNGDGCVDVRDVQTVAAAYTAPRPAPPDTTVPSHLFAPSSIGGLDDDVLSLAPGDVTFTVNSTADDADANTADGICATAAGVCTLRAAIQSANAHSGRDGIAFNIPGSGVQTIALASALPDLSDSSGGTEIDGYTQPGSSPNTDPIASNAVLRIAITGGGDAVEFAVLRMTSPNNVLRGVSIYRAWRKVWMAGPNAHDNVDRGQLHRHRPGGHLRLAELRGHRRRRHPGRRHGARQPDRRGDPGRTQRHLRQPAQRRAPLQRGHGAQHRPQQHRRPVARRHAPGRERDPRPRRRPGHDRTTSSAAPARSSATSSRATASTASRSCTTPRPSATRSSATTSAPT